MKFYLASDFYHIHVVRAVCNALQERGHTVTVKWWEDTALHLSKIKSPDAFYKQESCRLIFERDKAGIKEASAFILVAGDTPSLFGGANIEVGIAYGLEIPVFSVGNLKNSAMYYGVTRCQSISEILTILSDSKRAKQ